MQLNFFSGFDDYYKGRFKETGTEKPIAGPMEAEARTFANGRL